MELRAASFYGALSSWITVLEERVWDPRGPFRRSEGVIYDDAARGREMPREAKRKLEGGEKKVCHGRAWDKKKHRQKLCMRGDERRCHEQNDIRVLDYKWLAIWNWELDS